MSDLDDFKPPRPDFSKPPAPGNETWRREDVQAMTRQPSADSSAPTRTAEPRTDPVREHFEEWGVHMCDSVHLGAEAAAPAGLDAVRSAILSQFDPHLPHNEVANARLRAVLATVDSLLQEPRLRGKRDDE